MQDLRADGWAALTAGDWETAWRAFSVVVEQEGTPEAWED